MKGFESGLYRFTVEMENKETRASEKIFSVRHAITSKKQADTFLAGMVASAEQLLGEQWQWKRYSWEKIEQ
jgi:hypothetical protein